MDRARSWSGKPRSRLVTKKVYLIKNQGTCKTIIDIVVRFMLGQNRSIKFVLIAAKVQTVAKVLGLPIFCTWNSHLVY